MLESTSLSTRVPHASDRMDARIRPVAEGLSRAMRRLMDSIPGAPLGPTPLSRRLGINRVIASRLQNALACEDAYEVLHRVPGPESLRVVMQAAGRLGVRDDILEDANQAIEDFSQLIRADFGTRGALNAAISPHNEGLQRQFEHASRYHIFKGMRQVLGVEADTWLTSMIFTPSPRDDSRLSVTTIQGAIGMRRLRPDAQAYFTFGPPFQGPDEEHDLSRSPVGLEEFYTHAPADLESHVAGGQLVHRLAGRSLGKRAVVDMLAVSHDALGPLRYATPKRPRGGIVVFTDIPAKTLICDAILHESVFPGADPLLKFYKPGTRGPADPNDPLRDIDRIEFPERVDALGTRADRFGVPEIPRYDEMVRRVFGQIGHAPDAFRVYRLRMAYPVPGFQSVMAFDAPPTPGV